MGVEFGGIASRAGGVPGHFYAQARRKRIMQMQNSRFGHVLANRTLDFMHRRSGFALCAQARCFGNIVQNHCACARKSLVCNIVNNPPEYDRFLQESGHSSRGLAVIFPCCAPPAADGQKRLLEPFSNPVRAPPGHLPDGSRSPAGRLPDT